MRRRALVLDARPVAHGAARRLEVPGLPEGERHEPQHGRVARLGVARVDEPLRGQRVVALGHRVLGGGQEALHALGAGVGLGEVDELQRAGRDRAHPDRELHARPLLHVVARAGEVDAGHRPDAPLGVGHAARIAVHDRVVGHPRGERVVLGAVGVGGALALLLLVGAPAGLLARDARRRGAGPDGVLRDAAAARALGQRDELVGRLVDRLEVALVLELAARAARGRGARPWPGAGAPAARRAARTGARAPAAGGPARCPGRRRAQPSRVPAAPRRARPLVDELAPHPADGERPGRAPKTTRTATW